jgi:hypothetical protein
MLRPSPGFIAVFADLVRSFRTQRLVTILFFGFIPDPPAAFRGSADFGFWRAFDSDWSFCRRSSASSIDFSVAGGRGVWAL